MKARLVVELLKREYGCPVWNPDGDPVSMLIQTILSQNTSDLNSGSAFQSLRSAFPGWEEVLEADVDAIALKIRHGGLGSIKASRIRQVLRDIVQKRGRLELDFLKHLDLSEAEGWLLRLPGVGLKTARCVLLFSLGMTALPVDTHIMRVSKRLGLLSSKASADEAHRRLAETVSPEAVYHFHVLMIKHGRQICRARHPDCPNCVLKEICISYPLT